MPAGAASLTWGGFARGVRATLPLALGSFVFGLVFGVLAVKAGLDGMAAVVMSLAVNAGSAQYLAIDIWAEAFAPVPIVLATFAVNSRHLLMGVTLREHFGALPAWRIYPALFYLTDISWALSLREASEGRRDAGFMIGSGFILHVGWAGATALGVALGSYIGDPRRFGLDFTVTAFFVTLLVGMKPRIRDILPWVVAALAALLVSLVLPRYVAVLAGGLAGSLAGAIRAEMAGHGR